MNTSVSLVGHRRILAHRAPLHLAALKLAGLLSNQGEKSINLHFIMVPLRKKY